MAASAHGFDDHGAFDLLQTVLVLILLAYLLVFRGLSASICLCATAIVLCLQAQVHIKMECFLTESWTL